MGDTTNIPRVSIVRQDAEPQRKLDGMLWITESGGQNGNNIERYVYDKSSATWELIRSHGPDTPRYPAAGASWRDTSAGKSKEYDGSAWVNVIGDNPQFVTVEATDSIIDSAGVAHSSEIAESSDIPSGTRQNNRLAKYRAYRKSGSTASASGNRTFDYSGIHVLTGEVYVETSDNGVNLKRVEVYYEAHDTEVFSNITEGENKTLNIRGGYVSSVGFYYDTDSHGVAAELVPAYLHGHAHNI